MTFSEAAAARRNAMENPEAEKQAVEAASVALGLVDSTIAVSRIAAEGSRLAGDLKIMGATTTAVGAGITVANLRNDIRHGDNASAALHVTDLATIAAGFFFPPAEPFAIGYGGGRVAGDLTVLLSDSEGGSVLDRVPRPSGCP